MEQSPFSSDQPEGGEQRQEENREEEEQDPVDALNEKLRTEARRQHSLPSKGRGKPSTILASPAAPFPVEKLVDAWNLAQLKKRATEERDAVAQYRLAKAYIKGHHGVAQSAETAVGWADKAARQGHAGAQFLLGKMYAGGFGVERNADEVLGWWTKAVRKGHKQAQYHLGRLSSAKQPNEIAFLQSNITPTEDDDEHRRYLAAAVGW
ncbi:Sel1 domain containing protein [Acanthamoeba castellanii str. Neff]|uniref:Sel1 domain containing protein n=1 Tax=Acanthamoeba castellanii (strain ATCC 30010 / Neff) TaxID=1257118 RepID=L8HCF6_ACACF|nr:Sel1 domain containing protein [Acanthamoeba castellanii str. Neff]ELR22880.1 Sel1 domain containing protein [Acanthamoeba castellanii str. Neff]